MQKLLANYRAERTAYNARKLRAYNRAHPMASCLLTLADNDLLALAIRDADSFDEIADALAR